MKWSSVIHTGTMLIGLLGVIGTVTGWILKDKVVFSGITGNDLVDKSKTFIFIAIWIALGTLIHLVKEEDKEED